MDSAYSFLILFQIMIVVEENSNIIIALCVGSQICCIYSRPPGRVWIDCVLVIGYVWPFFTNLKELRARLE